MLDATILFGKAAILALPAGWLTAGAYDNLRHPGVNLSLIHAVMTMRDVRLEFPEFWQDYRHRAVTDERLIRLTFRAIVLCEAAIAVWMIASVVMLIGAAFGAVEREPALIGAIGASAAFTAIWGAFLIGGNLFHYWMPERNPQKTHYFMTIWGVATFVAMVSG